MIVNTVWEKSSRLNNFDLILVDCLQIDPDFEEMVWLTRGHIGLEHIEPQSIDNDTYKHYKKLVDSRQFGWWSMSSGQEFKTPTDNYEMELLLNEDDKLRELIRNIISSYYRLPKSLVSKLIFYIMTDYLKPFSYSPIKIVIDDVDVFLSDAITPEESQLVSFQAEGLMLTIPNETTKTQAIDWLRANFSTIKKLNQQIESGVNLRSKASAIPRYSKALRCSLLGKSTKEIALELGTDYRSVADDIKRYRNDTLRPTLEKIKAESNKDDLFDTPRM